MKWKVLILPPQALAESQMTLIRFARQEGERRITKHAIDWLTRLTPKKMAQQKATVALAMNGKRVVGLFAVSRCGLDQSFLVVDKRYRNRGIGKALTTHLCQRLPKLYVRVALDNEASLALFRGMGFEPVKASIGPTGKPTLWLAYGCWHPNDLQEHAG
ncbi:GNAT family N-acetyltransferase [Brevibacillus brevis]|uniref:GNAT family N-acetyltransferase n=1 Tax=Brevibacillus brevis TaxID=1393 RepID=A0ABY9T7Z8_BREBE|nr:GNAT family N-acetyltransferase [Brevibacillus brevis]WNC16215.1 GNAT family N-acetyltransferase [Brevibacillus brevis]